MEKPNVNNLNGVPNFGHGLEEEIVLTVAEEPSIDEVGKDSDTEDKPKKKKK